MNDEYTYAAMDIAGINYAVPLEYVSYIIAANNEFISCVPPGMPPFMKNIIVVGNSQMPVVSLETFYNSPEQPHPLITLLKFRQQQIGVLADNISLTHGQPEEISQNASRKFLMIGGKSHILFDVPDFFKKILAV